MGLNINIISEQYGFSEDEKKIMLDSGTANIAAMNQSKIVSDFILGQKVEKSADKIILSNEQISSSSEKLTQSIRTATWVGGIAATFGVVLGGFSLWHQVQVSDIQVKQKVFEECFDYYATVNREIGIDRTAVQTCKEKAEKFGL